MSTFKDRPAPLTGLPAHALARIESAADFVAAALDAIEHNDHPPLDVMADTLRLALQDLAAVRASVND